MTTSCDPSSRLVQVNTYLKTCIIISIVLKFSANVNKFANKNQEQKQTKTITHTVCKRDDVDLPKFANEKQRKKKTLSHTHTVCKRDDVDIPKFATNKPRELHDQRRC